MCSKLPHDRSIRYVGRGSGPAVWERNMNGGKLAERRPTPRSQALLEVNGWFPSFTWHFRESSTQGELPGYQPLPLRPN